MTHLALPWQLGNWEEHDNALEAYQGLTVRNGIEPPYVMTGKEVA